MKKIAILLATYNAAKFLAQQLLSLERQSYHNWSLYVLDDGSADDTLKILSEYQQKWGKAKLTVFSQANKGCVYSFLSLVCNDNINADYYAYCDQDDIWEEAKLERAISLLENNSNLPVPLLYCSSTQLVDKNNKIIGHSIVYKKSPCFEHALAQNIASGNTMVFNKQARDLVARVGVVNVPIHDWWTYLLITACGGKVFYDALSFIRYRQHDQNLIGYAKSRILSFHQLLERVKKVYSYQKQYQSCLRNVTDITLIARQTLTAFENSMKGNVIHRIYWLYKSKVFKQTWYGTLKLYVVVLLSPIFT